ADLNLKHPESLNFAKFLKLFGEDKNIIRVGYVDTNTLVKIYNIATIYCQPSYYEGFGIPILEAQACGTPVIASKTQALVEIAERSCVFADPNEYHNIANHIQKVIQDSTTRKYLTRE